MRTNMILAIALIAFAAPRDAAAQSEPRAVQFAGCWAPAGVATMRAQLCFVPSATGFEVQSFDESGQSVESTLRFDGERVAARDGDCEGWEASHLTADGERIVSRADLTCGTNPPQKRESSFSITPSGHLLQTTGAGLTMVASAQIRVYEPLATYAEVPAETRTAVMPHLAPAEQRRLAIRDNAVSVRDLVEFESMRVSPAIIDLLVAASYPRSFVIDGRVGVASAIEAEKGNARGGEADATPGFAYMHGYPMLTMYDWHMLSRCAAIYSVGCSAALAYTPGMGPFPYGYNARYDGWFRYGGSYYPGGYPVVIRPVVSAPRRPDGGRALRGRGYTQTTGTAGERTAAPRASGARSGASSGTGEVRSSSGSSGSSSNGSSSSGGSARTAKPRSPGS